MWCLAITAATCQSQGERRPEIGTGEPVPSLMLIDSADRSTSLHAVAASDYQVVWVFNVDGCLKCMTDVYLWKTIASDYPDLSIIAVAIGDESTARQLWSEEQPGFKLYTASPAAAHAAGLRVHGSGVLVTVERQVVVYAASGATAPFGDLLRLLRRDLCDPRGADML